MTTIYTAPKQYSVDRTGLEVYKTDEENFEPYVSPNVVTKTSKKTEDSDSEKETDSEDDKEEDVGFTLHRGEVLETYHYANIKSMEHEYDYKDMSDSASFKTLSVDKSRFYKGVRVCLKKEWEEPGQTLTWTDLQDVLEGFITEQTFSEAGVNVKVNGMTKLLEQKFQFDFKQVKRSKILEEIIKTAGLTPVIDVKGLDDDVTDYNNISSSSDSSSSELAGGEGADVDSLVASICKGTTDDLAKAKAIHEWLRGNVIYSGYSCSKYSSAAECLKHKSALNCADTARLTRAMMGSAGLKAWVAHHSLGPGHFWTVVEIGGKKYASDQTGRESSGMAGSAWDTVWYPSGRTSTGGTGGRSDRNCGKNPSC